MIRLEKLLFQLTVFLIPTNLFLKWILPESYVNGILVDYLLPKLYLSDLPLIGLLLLWFFRSLPTLKTPLPLSFTLLRKQLPYILIALLYFSLFLKAVVSPHPIAAVWYWFKLLEFGVFFCWLKAHPWWPQKSVIPLTLSLTCQAFVGLYQAIAQKSLAGFWLFGETSLTQTPNIAKISLGQLPFSQVSTLVITPYGTTPHSNVLGGFLAIGLVILFLLTRSIKKQVLYQKAIYGVITIVSLVTLFLTFSAAAWIALLAALIIIGLTLPSGKLSGKLLTLVVFALVSAVLFVKFNLFSLLLDEYSSLRRTQLIRAAIVMVRDHPILGIGLNQFTALLPDIRVISAYTSFLQPVHNIFLLWLAETGLVGLAMLILSTAWFTLTIARHFRKTKTRLQLIPLAMILIIGLFDHYPLTLQSGQLLLIWTLAFTTGKNLA